MACPLKTLLPGVLGVEFHANTDNVLRSVCNSVVHVLNGFNGLQMFMDLVRMPSGWLGPWPSGSRTSPDVSGRRSRLALVLRREKEKCFHITQVV